jgi:hypothetical protein
MDYTDIGGWVLLAFYIIFVFSAYININLKEIICEGCFNKIKGSERIRLYFQRKMMETERFLEEVINKIKERIREKTNEKNEEKKEEGGKKKEEEKKEEKNKTENIQKNSILDPKIVDYIKFERLFAGAMLDIVLVCSNRLIVWYVGRRWTLWFYTPLNYKNCEFEMNDNFKMTEIGFISILLVNFAVTLLVLGYMFINKKIFFDYKFRNYIFYNTYFLVLMHSFFEGMIQSIYSLS